MAASLPLELLAEVAGYLKNAGASLVACTAVCRHWQAAFEPFIYSTLNIYSEDGFNEGGICLGQFQELSSGAGVARRAWIRQLQYYIVVPFDLPDWNARKEEGYSTNNAIRQANDTAFQTAIVNLFNTLESWDKTRRLSVSLVLQGRELGQEPSTEEDDEAGLYTWDYTDGRTRSVPVYRARFHDNGASILRDVPCIDKISLPPQIWAGAAMQIARHCPELTELHLDLDDYIRPDHLEYMKERRQGEWIVHPTPEHEAMNAAIDDWEAEICDSERGCMQRPIFEQEQFHRLFISLGYAARHMPRLTAINFDLNHLTNLNFRFSNTTGSFSAEWELRLCDSYKPDDRVAAAWEFHLDDLLVKHDGLQLIATLPHWPLVEGRSM
ncbi:hypothetical protein IFM46972_09106 [Aspergillus udagawae]|uniref:F-box domain-containing protein n=1 Tax=Aspergillus udagawae TaxID=91492 RepID=A0A8H3S4H6_9EURO|nr:hypothetical protein IFM46972_09106 [Aspergillus udagawae]